jgi:uncharacterized protein (TIGR02996 family)
MPMDEAALVRAIVHAPADDAPRLVYADWLTARGDPRGEYIALSVAAARLAKDDDRDDRDEERERLQDAAVSLLDAHPEWLDALPTPAGARWYMERGLPTTLDIGGAAWLQHGEAIREAAPHLADLSFEDSTRYDDQDEEAFDGAAVVASLHGVRLRALELPFNQSLTGLVDDPARAVLEELEVASWRTDGPELAREIAASPHLGALKKLDVGGGAEAARAIAGATLPSLEVLRLDGDDLAAGIPALARWPRMRDLVELSLNAGGALGLESLFDMPLERLDRAWLWSPVIPPRAPVWSARLRDLCLFRAALTDELAAALSRWPLPAVRSLSFYDGLPGARAIASLASVPSLASLRYLCVKLRSADGLEQLVEGPAWGGLRSLSLLANGELPNAPDPLARATLLLFRSLSLNSFGAGVLERIAALPAWANLRHVSINNARVGDEGARAAATLPLRSLSLSSCGLTDAGARAILEAPALAAVRSLDLDDNTFSEPMMEALRARFGRRVSL